ncbi:hypothetical protein RZS08_07075, partial [Arthrospira platensis SPKY1]|nr:hypothetical protein [Arthrospira platensis SPKY1]
MNTQPDADEVLDLAHRRADESSAERGILAAALVYAVENPRWFSGADWSDPPKALAIAAGYDGLGSVAYYALMAAAMVADENPDLFKEP